LATAFLLLLVAGCNMPVASNLLSEDSDGASASEVDSSNIASELGKDIPAEGEIPYLWFSPDLPNGFRQIYLNQVEARSSASMNGADANVVISDEGRVVGHWVYALVAPFPTLVDEVTLEEIERVWRGLSVGPFGGPILLSPETLAIFEAWWGESARGRVEVMEEADLLDAAWASQPSWAIIPFEELAPRWKVLSVEGHSPLWKDFDPDAYALSVPIALSEAIEWAELPIISNRDTDALTTVVTTGVTALVRATAWEMERQGITYPAEDIGDLLREADVTHISNEVPFTHDCPPPNPAQRSLIFCSDAAYIELLEDVGTDVVELTGDHFNDWTEDAMLFTLDLYDERGWQYYGGGANIEEAKKSLLMEHNGNLIAFVGCNGKGGGYATADVDYPGAVECDYDFLSEEIASLVEQGYLVIATFQHNEVYTFVPQPGLIRDFGKLARAGATIVSGSQAHHAHGVEFEDDDTLIMYGLGNLFFDQIVISEETSQALIARHVFYEGRYLSTELFTTYFVDYAKPRYMTEEERETFLTNIFDTSIWPADSLDEEEGSEDGT
jgi:poly-gamma-glutamate synthesis protein (capsule biosynthesis protein)